MRPVVISIVVVLIGIGAWTYPVWTTTESNGRQFLQDGRKFTERQITFLQTRFPQLGIRNFLIQDGKIQVDSCDRSQCNKVLESSEFITLDEKKDQKKIEFSNPFVSPSEKERIAKRRRLEQLENIFAQLEGIRKSVILYDQAKPENFSRRLIQTATITLWPNDDHVVTAVQAATTRRMLRNSIAGLQEEDILVVDGDSGVMFHANTNAKEQLTDSDAKRDLELTRKQLEIQSKKILAKFGNPDVTVRMDFEKRKLPSKPGSIKPGIPADDAQQKSKVIANGTGSIKKASASTRTPKKQTESSVVMIKRLLGIDILIQRRSVDEYIRRQLGIENDVSDEQFSRGMVSLRNEITKDILLLLRGQNGIDMSSDLVSVSVAPDAEGSDHEESAAQTALISANMTPVIASIGILLAIGLLAFSWKSRRSNKVRAGGDGLSGGGRNFVHRNQTNTGREMAEEANEVVHSAPANSARAFQNLVAGENN